MAIPKCKFDADKIRLKKVFDNTESMGYTVDGLECSKVEDVYGKLMFSKVRDDRPITYASYVMSIDGKIAFKDNECGPLVAKKNHLDSDGAFADFWVLNMLRGNCDGIVIGSGTLIKEPEYSGSAYDPDILESRVRAGMPEAPWTVIVTSTGKNIPFYNPVFSSKEIPVLVATSQCGLENLKLEIPTEYFVLPKYYGDKSILKNLLKENKGKTAVVVTGENDQTDSKELLAILRDMGMEKLLIESPTYCHHLMEEELLDEIFINTSCVFVCGDATSIGSSSEAFNSKYHPHSEIISIHMHSPHFIYTRYKMIYGIR